MDDTTTLPARKILYKYIRFSSIQQAKGSSFARQNARLDKYAEENGFEIDDSLDLRDFAKSGFHGINKEIDQGLGRFIAAIDKGLIPTDGSAYLAVEQFDRISREDIDKAQDLFKSILRKNVNIITLMDGRIYTKKSLSNFMEVLYSLFLMEQAHQESLKKSERIKGAYANKVKKLKDLAAEQKEKLEEWNKTKSGKKPELEPLINQVQFSSQVPCWIDQKIEIISGRKFKKFVINEEKAEIVRYALSLLSDENGYMNVAAQLNAEKIPRLDFNANKKRSTRKDIWTNRAINEFVNSDAIFGDLSLHENFFAEKEFEYDGLTASKKVSKRTHIENIPNYYPAVVDKKMVMGLRARANSKKKGRVAGRTTTNNLFQNMLFCGRCGDSMHLIQSKRTTSKGTYQRFYLVCYAARHKACTAKMFPYEQLEQQLVKYLINPVNTAELNEEGKIIESKRQEKLLVLKGEIDDIQKRIDEFRVELRTNKNIKLSVASSIIAEFENDKSFKQSKIAELEEQTEKLHDALQVGDFSNFDLENDKGRNGFKVAIKQRYSGFIVFTNEQIVFALEKTGATTIFKIENKSRWGTNLKPEKGDIFSKQVEVIKFLREKAENYKEGKLYEMIQTFKATNIDIFEGQYIGD
ncbi:TPA: recombinase family protein [Pseudomonas aeruginosa]|nr:recombinase family protein [Pseudomonas aeruginosa]